MKYKTGDKFIIEIDEVLKTESSVLYKIKGFNSLVFDGFGLNKLDRYVNSMQKNGLVEIQEIIPGTTVKAGGIEMEVIDPAYASSDGKEFGVLCLAKDVLFREAFDEKNHNEWRESSLREYLNGEFKDSLPGELKNVLLPFKRNLISDDGKDNYGICEDYVSLISYDEYRKYRKYISSKSSPWWTLTPYSCDASASSFARIVNMDGTLSNGVACGWYIGVAPVFLLHPSVYVEIVWDEK